MGDEEGTVKDEDTAGGGGGGSGTGWCRDGEEGEETQKTSTSIST